MVKFSKKSRGRGGQGFRNAFVFFIGIFSFLYLLNLSAGFIEFVPDNIIFAGNADEVFFAATFFMSLGYFGLKLPSFKKTGKLIGGGGG